MITGMVLGFTMPCKRFFQNKFWMDNEAQCDEEDKIIWLEKKKNWVLIGVYDSGWLKTSILVYSTSVSASSSLQERKCISKTYLCKDSLLLSFLISHLLWQDVCCITTSHCVVILCYICMIFMQIFLLKCVTCIFLTLVIIEMSGAHCPWSNFCSKGKSSVFTCLSHLPTVVFNFLHKICIVYNKQPNRE